MKKEDKFIVGLLRGEVAEDSPKLDRIQREYFSTNPVSRTRARSLLFLIMTAIILPIIIVPVHKIFGTDITLTLLLGLVIGLIVPVIFTYVLIRDIRTFLKHRESNQTRDATE